MLPWFETVLNSISKEVAEYNLPNAWLILLPKGLEPDELLNDIEMLILCPRRNAGKPCKNCRSCRLVQIGNHPDLIPIDPSGKSNRIGIDAVRTNIQDALTTPFLGLQKLVRINQAECLNESATNALLKIVEEPSQRTVFLLVSKFAGKVLPTLFSRCRKLYISLPNKRERLDLAKNLSIKPNIIEDGFYLLGEPMVGVNNTKRLEFARSTCKMLLSIARGENPEPIIAKLIRTEPSLVLVVLSRLCEASIRMSLGIKNDDDLNFLSDYPTHIPKATRLFSLYDRINFYRESLLKGIALNTSLIYSHVLAIWSQCWRPY